ncbi:MAG: DUF2877 domain-containing protein [Chloroflexi bacterium]|nr:DUF2877 domain-containing protein [Chloroflexota bacterium]
MVGELVVGATARDLLARPRFGGAILAVVTGAVYLQGVIARSDFRDEAISKSRFGDCFASLAMTNGEILWLAQNDLPMHPRALRGDFDFGALRVGMPFQSDGAALRFVGAQLIAPLHNARVWQPTAIDPARVASRETVMARVRESDLTGFPKPVRSLDNARALIGLGEGLTPSGDDFVGGWLFAAYHLHATYPKNARWDQRAVDDLLEYARTRTNVISYALLRDHARGQSIAPLHEWIAALMCGAGAPEIEAHAQRVRALGSTTGENLLAGALAAITA